MIESGPFFFRLKSILVFYIMALTFDLIMRKEGKGGGVDECVRVRICTKGEKDGGTVDHVCVSSSSSSSLSFFFFHSKGGWLYVCVGEGGARSLLPHASPAPHTQHIFCNSIASLMCLCVCGRGFSYLSGPESRSVKRNEAKATLRERGRGAPEREAAAAMRNRAKI